ncbi:MAG: ABC-F family ATP-binding cassette domain-containing protein [Ruminococcaceae bacterium]|nr:ABC-F family ATP-binding cassette domain-containing protein [Oscillospiraceae bacterium]
MIALACDKISLSFGAKSVLENVSFSVQTGEKLGIVGVNGAGKSTLFSVITGNVAPDSGNVYIAKGCSVGYLAQNAIIDSERTLFEEMLDAQSDLIAMEEKLSVLRERAEGGDESASLEFSLLHERFISEGGLEYRGRCRGILSSLGFSETVQGRSVNSLSGGQKTRVALAKLLVREPDIILLDEPTNHLDVESIAWLEKFISGSKKTFLIISHDRYFLCSVTDHTLEIEHTRAKLYNGNYDKYLETKKRDREILEHHYKNQQKEIARIEAYIEQQRRWNREKNIIAAESRQKQLDKMVRIEAPTSDPTKVRMRFEQSEESGDDVLSVKRLSKSYGEKKLFADLSFEVKKRDRVFIIGTNGCGKSTLIKILNYKETPDAGRFDYGYNVKSGYYDQENQNLTPSATVLDELWDCYADLTQTEVRNALALFNFRSDDIFKEVRVLSGGEKARLTFAKMMLSKTNTLFLDEPTNHLDIPSREVLEDAIEQFPGTVIAVSHDRYFIKKLATRILSFEENGVLDFDGTYEDYLRYKERVANSEETGGASQNEESVSDSKKKYLEDKKSASERRKRERRIAYLYDEIKKTENALDAVEREMSGEAASDHVRLTELYGENTRLEEYMLECMQELEELESLQ